MYHMNDDLIVFQLLTFFFFGQTGREPVWQSKTIMGVSSVRWACNCTRWEERGESCSELLYIQSAHFFKSRKLFTSVWIISHWREGGHGESHTTQDVRPKTSLYHHPSPRWHHTTNLYNTHLQFHNPLFDYHFKTGWLLFQFTVVHSKGPRPQQRPWSKVSSSEKKSAELLEK